MGVSGCAGEYQTLPRRLTRCFFGDFSVSPFFLGLEHCMLAFVMSDFLAVGVAGKVDMKDLTPNKITAANADGRLQFRFRGLSHRPGVAEFWR